MASFLFTWKENRWPWETLSNDLRAFKRDRMLEIEWSAGNTKRISIGDDAFLIRLGDATGGVFGFGKVISTPEIKPHYDATKSSAGKTVLTVRIALTAFTDPRRQPYIPLSELQAEHDRNDNWTPQASGTEIEADTSASLAGRIQRAQQENNERVFGPIRDVLVGRIFEDRKELASAGIHRPLVAGISGSESHGADSIVISGGYEDDEDHGSFLTYTGAGGNDSDTKKQIADQVLKGTNLALAKSCLNGLPVRVVRGADKKNRFSPSSGYRYEGIFRVTDYWHDLGKSKFKIYRFRLEQIDPTSGCFDLAPPREPRGNATPGKVTSTVTRVVRDTSVSLHVKKIHDNVCQVCATRIVCPSGFYSEAAHIRPLGAPHNGPDVVSNVLCLCPNHHVMFDKGVFSIADDLSFVGYPAADRSELLTNSKHPLDKEHLRYHRMHIYEPA